MKLKKGYLHIALFSIFLSKSPFHTKLLSLLAFLQCRFYILHCSQSFYRNLHSIQSFYLLYWYFSQHFSGKHCQSDFSRYQLHFFPFSCRDDAFSHFPKSNNVLFCGGNLIEFSERLVSLELVGRKDKHLRFNIPGSNLAPPASISTCKWFNFLSEIFQTNWFSYWLRMF